MLFKKYHIKMIKDGIKTATRRNWKIAYVKVDGTYAAQTRMYQPRKLCPIIKVNELYKQRLGDMTEEDAWKEGHYTLEYFKGIVWPNASNTAWNDDLEPFVVEFKLI